MISDQEFRNMLRDKVTDEEFRELMREKRVDELSPNKLLTRYLMSSYLYYEQSVSIYSDSDFDELCYRLRDNFDKVDHSHKYLVNVGQLDAGTGFYLHGKYPLIVQHAAWDWYLRSGKAGNPFKRGKQNARTIQKDSSERKDSDQRNEGCCLL